MRTAVADSSIQNFHLHRASGKLGEQQARIFAFMVKNCHKSFTRKELARALNMEPGTVAGRVNELIHGLHLLEELPIRTCAVSGRSAHAVRVADPQMDLV